jgi:CBS domain-containing protein
MTQTADGIMAFLASVHPYDSLSTDALADLATRAQVTAVAADASVYAAGDVLPGLYVIRTGSVEVRDPSGDLVSVLGPRNSFGERGLLRDGRAVTTVHATAATDLIVIPAPALRSLIDTQPAFRRFFDRTHHTAGKRADLATTRVDTLMTQDPATCASDTTVTQAAQILRDRHISSVCVTEGDRLAGIVTLRDLSTKVLARERPGTTPVSQIMTTAPLTLAPSALGSDVLHAMMERRIGHIPIVEAGRLVGMVTQTDLTRFQAVSAAELVGAVARATDVEQMAAVTRRIPQLLVQLVAAGSRHDAVTRLITDIADAATRRLLALAHQTLGPAPCPYLWLACGSQGRQEQTGVSDQDNCLFLDDAATPADDAYFAALARFVCDGLNAIGYVHCPGDMMATNPRWRQPLRVWRSYFDRWIATPDPEAQMLASVMFDLRPIGGETALFADLQADTLRAASANSIFVAHMVSNSLKHQPPLGLLRGIALIRSGEHKNAIDMKMGGVVPIVDMGRIHALRLRLAQVNTRARLEAAAAAGAISASGGHDLLDAYDLIAQTRLEHQAALVRAGDRPDNFLVPGTLSDFERSHLRDAFVVVRTMQSALAQGRGLPG